MQTPTKGRNPTQQKAPDFAVKWVNSNLRIETFSVSLAIMCHLLLSRVTHVTGMGSLHQHECGVVPDS
jgi:hypothetical protein